ncbi:MAG: DUF2191 domain-containing protein [Myxococcales bacterium]|nr:DUF2191 domain-containing protein [Myxococcales bacterium]
MKTTVEISDALLESAKELAAREGSSVRRLIEDGLRRVIAERQKRGRFQLRDASFRGNGLSPAFREAGWDQIRDAIYEGREG